MKLTFSLHRGDWCVNSILRTLFKLVWNTNTNTHIKYTKKKTPIIVRTCLSMTLNTEDKTHYNRNNNKQPCCLQIQTQEKQVENTIERRKARNMITWVGQGSSLNPEKCKITFKMCLNTTFITFWKKSESWNLAIARKCPPPPPPHTPRAIMKTQKTSSLIGLAIYNWFSLPIKSWLIQGTDLHLSWRGVHSSYPSIQREGVSDKGSPLQGLGHFLFGAVHILQVQKRHPDVQSLLLLSAHQVGWQWQQQ